MKNKDFYKIDLIIEACENMMWEALINHEEDKLKQLASIVDELTLKKTKELYGLSKKLNK